jgi:hypothetical protein
MNKNEDQQRESQRILARMQAQTDGGVMTAVQRTAKRGRDHFAASDADEADPIEVWGTRIGRGISLILFVCLLVYIGLILLGA